MSQQTINTTDSPETGRGKINANFTEVYNVNNLLPSQTGNSGKFLTTNGTVASWTGTGTLREAVLSSEFKYSGSFTGSGDTFKVAAFTSIINVACPVSATYLRASSIASTGTYDTYSGSITVSAGDTIGFVCNNIGDGFAEITIVVSDTPTATILSIDDSSTESLINITLYA